MLHRIPGLTYDPPVSTFHACHRARLHKAATSLRVLGKNPWRWPRAELSPGPAIIRGVVSSQGERSLISLSSFTSGVVLAHLAGTLRQELRWHAGLARSAPSVSVPPMTNRLHTKLLSFKSRLAKCSLLPCLLLSLSSVWLYGCSGAGSPGSACGVPGRVRSCCPWLCVTVCRDPARRTADSKLALDLS